MVLNLATYDVLEDHELPIYLDRAVLTFDGEHIVHPSEHPSYQLWRSSFDGTPKTLLVTLSDRIEFHARIPGTEDYVFSSYLNDVDVLTMPLSVEGSDELSQQSKQPGNSSVMDYLPAIQNQGDVMAFVSKRTGQAEIWSHHLTEGITWQLSNMASKVRFYQLQWSPDDKNLAVLTQRKYFFIIAAKIWPKHKVYCCMMLNEERCVWLSNNELGFQEKTDRGWQSFRYDLITDQIQPSQASDFFSEDLTDAAIPLAQQHCQFDASLKHFLMKENRTALYCMAKTAPNVNKGPQGHRRSSVYF